jgi:hypothetical protein
VFVIFLICYVQHLFDILTRVMNPQEQEHAPSFELPAARQPEQLAQNVPEGQSIERTEKQGSVAVEHAAMQQSPPAPPPSQLADPQSSVAQPVSSTTDDISSGTTLAHLPQVAEDSDLIEKAWVTKAKEIVARTAHDPHLQNKEMNKFKADYMKKRYNKDIKLSED